MRLTDEHDAPPNTSHHSVLISQRRATVLVHGLQDGSGELLPSLVLMGIAIARADSKAGIEHENTLLCPFLKVAMLRDFELGVGVLYLLVNLEASYELWFMV